METLDTFPQALTFDDVLLQPAYAGFFRSDINLTVPLTRRINLAIPLVSAPMDTVTDAKLAIALAREGGIGIIHRNLTIADQAEEVRKVKREQLLVGAAIGSSAGYEERVEALLEAGVDTVVIDSAHGFSKPVIDTLRYLKAHYPLTDIIAGNVATEDGAKALVDAGADALRVGMGPGAICTTRVVSGMGVPQVTALRNVAAVAQQNGVPVIADGGINQSGDMVKALALKASTVMMGAFFAATLEAPGKGVPLTSEEVPKRFKSITPADGGGYLFKVYRGMGSVGAMRQGAAVASEDEFHGKNYSDAILIAEGVEGMVPVRGSVHDRVQQALGGIRSGLYNCGARTVSELWKTARFVQVTSASLRESHPHDILVTETGESYW